MARILITWELGGGLGHLVSLQKISEYFINQGHEVWLASKDVAKVKGVFGSLPIKLVQAPCFATGYQTGQQPVTSGFGELLYRLGYHSTDTLQGVVSAWHYLIQLISPDMLVVDHSPTALIASRSINIPKIAVGTGFSVPDANKPAGLFFHHQKASEIVTEIEVSVVKNINTVCEQSGIKCIESLKDVFDDLTMSLFQIYPELDHYGPYRCSDQKRNIVYVGTTLPAFSDSPDFPVASGPKIFCYLKWRDDVTVFLKALQSIKCSAIVVVTGIPDEVIQKHQAEHICYTKKTVNIQMVLQQADLGVGNATMNTLSQFLKSGVPMAVIPLHVEQLLTARRLESMGSGILLDLKSPHTVIEGLKKSCGIKVKLRASAFAKKYQQFDPQKALIKELALIEKKYLLQRTINRTLAVRSDLEFSYG